MTEALHPYQLAGKKLGNYRLEQPIGAGRMGIVYLARDEALLRPAAVKILSWSLEQRFGQDPLEWFVSEARTVARIVHPGIVQIYHVSRHNEIFYIAMEYISGPSVELALAQQGPFSPARATDVLLQVAEALTAAHLSGVIHRDIKPANLLITPEGVVKLSDFGMALNPTCQKTAAEELRVGTPCYTAPELWQHGAATEASDLYSLGATYFHLLTGEPPFKAHDAEALERLHVSGEIPDPCHLLPTVPARCAEIVRRCLAKTPKERFASARELSWAARALLRETEGPCTSLVAESFPESDDGSLSFLRARGRLADELGFAWQPFSELDPHRAPYSGEPFRGLGAQLGKQLSKSGAVVLLTGPSGSGRTVLCRQQTALMGRSSYVLYLETAAYRGGRTLIERLRRLAGITAAGAAAPSCDLEALLARLDDTRRRHGRKAVIILDGLALTPEEQPDVEMLVRAALGTGSYSLLLIGAEELPDKLSRAGMLPEQGPTVLRLKMPPLTGGQTIDYVQAWVGATLAPEAPPVLVSPDASLLVNHFTGGNLTQANRLATMMITLAAVRGRRTVTSWDAWFCAQHLNENIFSPTGPTRAIDEPAGWPSEEPLALIQDCRQRAKLPLRQS